MSSLKTEAPKLLKAEEAVKAARGVLEQAERERDKARERCRPLLATGKTTVAGDIAITVTPCVSAETFRLAEYKRRYKVTDRMAPFVGEGTEWERWTCKRIAA